MTADEAPYVGSTSEEARLLELDPRRADVLAIGSQLTYGRVGLNAALPVYAAAGLRTAAVPTTILSVLPHYPSVHRVDLPPDWIADTLADLGGSGALDQVRLTTAGYLATPEQVELVAQWRAQADDVVPFIVDPTLGDIGLGFYNDPRVADALREHLMRHATGVIPNLFELAHLTAQPPAALDSVDRIATAARQLLSAQTSWVVVTGLRGPALEEAEGEPRIGELVVTHEGADVVTHRLIPAAPVGVGDTFTAALVAALLGGVDLPAAVSAAADSTARHIRGAGEDRGQ